MACVHKDAKYLRIAKILIESGADVSIRNQSGSTPLYAACGVEYPELVKLLLDSGADPNQPSYSEIKVIEVAREVKNSQIIALLNEAINTESAVDDAKGFGSTKEDDTIGLKEKIDATWLVDNDQLKWGEYQGSLFYSDGHFLAITEELPSEIADAIETQKSPKLPSKVIEKSIPKDLSSRGRKVDNIIESFDEEGDVKVVLLKAGSFKVVVDSRYYEYLSALYPKSEVVIVGKIDPVVFLQEDKLVALVMPRRG